MGDLKHSPIYEDIEVSISPMKSQHHSSYGDAFPVTDVNNDVVIGNLDPCESNEAIIMESLTTS